MTVLRGWVNSVTEAIEKRLGKGNGKNSDSGKDSDSGSGNASGSGKENSGSDRMIMQSMSIDGKDGVHINDEGHILDLEHGPDDHGEGGLIASASASSSAARPTLTLIPPSPKPYYLPGTPVTGNGTSTGTTGDEIPPPPTLADFPSPYSIDGHISKGTKMHQWDMKKIIEHGYGNDIKGGYSNVDTPSQMMGQWSSENVSSPVTPIGGVAGMYNTPDGMISPSLLVMTSLSSPRTVFKACVEELTVRQNTNQF